MAALNVGMSIQASASSSAPEARHKGLNFAKAALPVAISAAVLVLAARVLVTELRHFSADDFRTSLLSIDAGSLGVALLLTVLSYAVLGIVEWVGLATAGKRLGVSRALFVSFISSSFAHNIGFGVLTGAAIRYRMYKADGLSALDTASVTLFVSVTFGLGSLALLAISALLAPEWLALAFHIQPMSARIAGVILALGLLAYIASSTVVQGLLRRFGLNALPDARLAALQVAMGAIDLLLSAGVIYVLLPASAQPGFTAFASCYIVATWAGIVSYVPGGIGVFEAVMLMLSPSMPQHMLLAVLAAYRCLYYLLPLAGAGLALGWSEARANSVRLKRMARSVEFHLAPLLAPVVSGLVFLGGIVLLVSGATPTIEYRMSVLKAFLPLPLIEVSHMAGSISGTALLLLAHGLFRRLDGAYVFTTVMLGLGIVVSLLKGLDYEEAIVLSIILGLLWLSREAFYRRSSLLAEQYTAGWLLTVAAAMLGSIWLGMFSYRNVEYSNLLWVNFTFDGDASRFLRATVVASVCAIAFAALRLVRAARPESRALPEDIASAFSIARTSDDTLSQLVCTGDKSILFSDSRKSFLMFAVQRQSWVTLGGPFGEKAEVRELAWKFRQLCDAHDARPVFYQIATDELPLFLDMGLSIVKLGEEGVVDLRGFSLEGKRGRDMRLARNRAHRDGMSFEIIPAAQFDVVLDELKAISDEWLETQRAAEKGFSLGSFSPEYLRLFNTAAVRQQGKLVAFANLLESESRAELSIDLMRHTQGASGAMDFLFAEMMLWGAQNGYGRFNLGMAPLSGLESRPLAPLWHRAGSLIYRHGEAFYNFRGLRQFKEKFKPEWRPRFMAFPGALSLPYVLFDVGTLVSGGLKEMITK